MIPSISETAYLAYKNVRMQSFRRDSVYSFTPVVSASNNGGATDVWLKTPQISVTNLNALHYGMSFLFVKPSGTATTFTLRGVLTC